MTYFNCCKWILNVVGRRENKNHSNYSTRSWNLGISNDSFMYSCMKIRYESKHVGCWFRFSLLNVFECNKNQIFCKLSIQSISWFHLFCVGCWLIRLWMYFFFSLCFALFKCLESDKPAMRLFVHILIPNETMITIEQASSKYVVCSRRKTTDPYFFFSLKYSLFFVFFLRNCGTTMQHFILQILP